MKYIDPDGRVEVESPYTKNRSDPENKRGYQVTLTNYRLPYLLFVKSLGSLFPISLSKSNSSRAEGCVVNDRGDFSLDGFYRVSDWMLRDPEKRGPIADRITMDIYKVLFGGDESDTSLTVPKGQSYKDVRNRIGYIYGLVAFIVGGHDPSAKKDGVPFLEGINVGQEENNLSDADRRLIIEEVNMRLKSGELSYER